MNPEKKPPEKEPTSLDDLKAIEIFILWKSEKENLRGEKIRPPISAENKKWVRDYLVGVGTTDANKMDDENLFESLRLLLENKHLINLETLNIIIDPRSIEEELARAKTEDKPPPQPPRLTEDEIKALRKRVVESARRDVTGPKNKK